MDRLPERAAVVRRSAVTGARIRAKLEAMKSLAVGALVLGACGFEGSPAAPVNGDATHDATIVDDAAIDARPIDAAECPAAPSGCTAFSCAASTSCYYHCTTKLSYTDATARCESAGMGCITRVDSLAEDTCLHDFAMPDFQAGTIAFIGFRQEPDQPATDAGWNWQCGDTTYLPANWGTFEPNDNDGNPPFNEMNRENCAALVGDNAWLDIGCIEPRRYICELER